MRDVPLAQSTTRMTAALQEMDVSKGKTRPDFWAAVKAQGNWRHNPLNDVVALGLGVLLLYLLQGAAGPGSAMVSSAVNVSSSETPPGEWLHAQSRWSADPTAALLSHSQIYNDPEVIELVAGWFKRGRLPGGTG